MALLVINVGCYKHTIHAKQSDEYKSYKILNKRLITCIKTDVCFFPPPSLFSSCNNDLSQSGICDDCVLRVGAHFAADLSGQGDMQSVS